MSSGTEKLSIVDFVREDSLRGFAKSAWLLGSSLLLALLIAYAPLAASVTHWQTPDYAGMQSPAATILDAGKRATLALNAQDLTKVGARALLTFGFGLSCYAAIYFIGIVALAHRKTHLIQLGRLQLEGG